MQDRMTQIKFTIDSDIVSTFKARCAAKGISMTSVVRQWMRTIKPTSVVKSTVLSRPKRRIAVVEIIGLLNDILEMEEQYRDSIPEQFAQRYEYSDHACEHLAEAIDCLREAFTP
jgi:hypothetical protein